MQLSNLPTATIASLKSFARANNLLPTGDLRLKATWLEAVTAFLSAAVEIAQETIEGANECISEFAAYDNAVIAANTANVWARQSLHFTRKAIWNVFLVSIALVMLAIEAYKNRQQIGLTIRTDATARINLWKHQSRYQYAFLRTHGHSVFRRNVVKPVLSRRDQIRETMKSALLK